MRFVAVLAIVVAALTGHVWSASPAAACSCSVVTDELAYDQADVVFVGDVVSTPTIPVEGNWSSIDPGVWTFSVHEVYKGRVSAQQQIVSALSGASCGLELPTTGKVVVFATADPAGSALEHPVGGADLHASLCGGSRPLRDAALPASFGASARPAVEPVDDLEASAAEPGAPDRTDRSLALPVAAGIGLLVLAAVATGVLIIRPRRT